MLDNVFDRLFANGPIACGAVVDHDAISVTRDGINKGANASATAVYIYCACPPNVNDAVACVVAAGAGFLASVDGAIDETLVSQRACEWEAADGAIRAAPDNATSQRIIAMIPVAMAMIAAMKVNYWKTNHHTGQGRAQGYLLKCAQAHNLDISSPEALAAIWRLGHWADTRVFLATFGIPSIRADVATVTALRTKIVLSDDARKRIASNPAGVSSWVDVWTAIQMAAADPIACQAGISLSGSRASYLAQADAIAQDPARYHMGSKYLTGSDRIEVPAWEDSVVSWARTAVEFINADSTLLNAGVFRNVSANMGQMKTLRAIANKVAEAADIKGGIVGLAYAE